jgi:predicted metalloprotease with PDZ domain
MTPSSGPTHRLVALVSISAAVLLMGTRPAASRSAARTRPTEGTSAAGPIAVSVDATEAPRRILHARLTFPASPGPLTLLYPQWIPGEHAPSGPVTDLAGLRFRAGEREIPWSRQPDEMYAFRLEVPQGVASIEAALDFLLPDAQRGFSEGASATPELALICWNQVVLYPKGAKAAGITYRASLTLPPGWKHATALPETRAEGQRVEFGPVSLETLVDSPVLAGAHFRTVDLAPGGAVRQTLEIAADSEAALQMSDAQTAAYRRLVAEAQALFGARHYDHYSFLYTLSDHVAHFGLEHHQSSDDRVDERTLLDDDLRLINASLLPHEFVHSWNGKYRRPADIATPDYQEPMKTGLLWVYEGLTHYLGRILTARSGLWTPDQFRDYLALSAAHLDHEAGRKWRPLADTAVAAQLLYGAREGWANLRRGTDFYEEGVLIWLEADTVIRERSGGTKSLDDFCRLFHGAPDSSPRVVPYTEAQVYETLNRVVSYDWRGFFDTRVRAVQEHAPLGGIAAGGWRLVFTGEIPPYLAAWEKARKTVDLQHSIGLVLERGGRIRDVVPDLPAARAGLAPGMKIVAVDGRRYGGRVLRAALRAAKGGTAPVSILAENDGVFATYAVDAREGERYPHLERDPARPDLLTAIIAPHAKAGG